MATKGPRIPPYIWISCLSFLCVAALSIILGVIVTRSLTGSMLDREFALTGSFIQSQVREHALYDFFLQPATALGEAKRKELVTPLQNIPEVVRIKVYDRQGTILWADEPRLIGQHFGDNPDLQEALEGKIKVEFKQTRKSENLFEWDRYSTLAEMYVPIFQADGRTIIGVVELYKYPVALLGQMRKARLLIWAICLAGGALLQGTIYWHFRRTHRLQRQIEEASRHKSEFLANMSHELRTPLSSIIGFAELLLGNGYGPLTERQARFLWNIRQSGDHLLQLINDILDLSKVEAGKLTLESQPLEVAEALEDILVVGRGLASKEGQTVDTQIAPGLPPIWADPIRFKQICFNLLSNAVKFTPQGGHVTVSVRELPGPIPSDQASCVEFRVTDTGIGIRAEDLPRLFREFVQLEATATKRHEGTGLGLALTKSLVELHGGRIWAESAGEGQGSTFTVLLPLAGLAGGTRGS